MHKCMCTHVCVCGRGCVCLCVCMSVCVHVYMCVHVKYNSNAPEYKVPVQLSEGEQLIPPPFSE